MIYFFLVFLVLAVLGIIEEMDQKLSQIIHNYLKSKENISSFSPLTLKAYETDLKQAFENKLDIVCKCEELWPLVRNTLSRWGHLSLSSRNRKIATLKSFFGWLYDEKLLDRDYSNQLICPKIPKKTACPAEDCA